ncbi:hypothetical protein quinque_005899 [Culex quinquefasciatus]
MGKEPKVYARTVLWYLVFVGFAVNYMIRINMNITIVTMVKQAGRKSSAASSELDTKEDGFEWNEYEQGLVLGAFFWLHWVTQIPGGVLARKYGTKMGVICGVAWPAMHHMAGQWIPPNERSKFITAYLGSSVGVALNFPLFGYIISWSSWEYVFHFCGIFGTIWYLAWVVLVYDSPAEHPRIHPKEREYIESSLGITEKSKEQDRHEATPWKEMMLSKAMWMTVIAQWAGIWGLFTVMTQAPSYFNYIHGWDIKMTGLLSGIPHLCRMIFAYFFSMMGDYLLRNNLMSRTNVRKMGGASCCVLNGIFVLGLAYSGCHSTAAILFLTLATMAHGAVSTGPLANIVDMSPKYAGILLGISGMIGVIPGFVSPIIVGILTLGNQTVKQWEYVFLITAGMLIVGGILYMLFADSTQQPWNSAIEEALDARELVSLKLNVEDAMREKEREAGGGEAGGEPVTAEIVDEQNTSGEDDPAKAVLVR